MNSPSSEKTYEISANSNTTNINMKMIDANSKIWEVSIPMNKMAESVTAILRSLSEWKRAYKKAVKRAIYLRRYRNRGLRMKRV